MLSKLTSGVPICLLQPYYLKYHKSISKILFCEWILLLHLINYWFVLINFDEGTTWLNYEWTDKIIYRKWILLFYVVAHFTENEEKSK